MNFDIVDGLLFKPNSVGLINANLSLHYFDWDKTVEIFDNIYKILELGGIFVGRMNSDKNDYIDDDFVEIEEYFYYDSTKEQHKRLFNKSQFDKLTKKWEIIILEESETIRKGRKKIYLGIYLKKIN